MTSAAGQPAIVASALQSPGAMSAFPVTRHSIVAAIRSDRDDVRRSAFDALVTRLLEAGLQVRAPQMARVAGRCGRSDAGVFPAGVREGLLRRLRPGEARFRTYLRTCLDGFVANARKADARLKRGGGVTLVPLDFDEAERELRLPGDQRDRRLRRLLPPRVAARPVRVGRGAPARRLRRARTRGAVHACSSSTTWPARRPQRPTYAELARRLGLSPIDVTNELAAARREFRRFVLEALREQCATDEEFDAESRGLTG